jgi:hypothetical protein
MSLYPGVAYTHPLDLIPIPPSRFNVPYAPSGWPMPPSRFNADVLMS